jgi:hypothetical protein
MGRTGFDTPAIPSLRRRRATLVHLPNRYSIQAKGVAPMPVRACIYVLVLISLTLCGRAQGEEIRDFYSAPRLNPFKETINQENNEHIDPFSGTLQYKHVDLFIPVNGGMDIKITRVYTSLQEHLGVRTVTGVGWTMHFGRLVVPTLHKDKLCVQENYKVSTEDNPSVEFPDGGRELLTLDHIHGQYLVTRSGWRMQCNSGSAGRGRDLSRGHGVYDERTQHAE